MVMPPSQLHVEVSKFLQQITAALPCHAFLNKLLLPYSTLPCPQADLDGSGTLNFSEYASALMVKRLDDTRIRTAFDFFDRYALRTMERWSF